MIFVNNTTHPVDHYWRAANYLTAAQLFLKDNCLLDRPLTIGDFKSQIIGHWGTCPGINFIYGHLNHAIKKHQSNILLVVGPGHGAAALLSNLYLEGALCKDYPKMNFSREGLQTFIGNFGVLKGFPTEISPEMPGVVYQGGELGHSLSFSYGVALDNPNLTVACIIGDGEAETGSISSSWYLNRFMNPARDGIVLPIIHLNGYKMASGSIYGSMTDKELISFFGSLGYEPLITGFSHRRMSGILNYTLNKIKKIKNSSKVSIPSGCRLPLIILRTPKGFSGLREFNGELIQGTANSHKALPANIGMSDALVPHIEKWLKSYSPTELFTPEGKPSHRVLQIIPRELRKMSNTADKLLSKTKELTLPDFDRFKVLKSHSKNNAHYLGPRQLSNALASLLQLNHKHRNFRIFSPDEIESNGFGGILNVAGRCPIRSIGTTEAGDENGRIIEILNENICQGLFQGYSVSGRYGFYITYEAFAPIISSTIIQYMKFLKQHETSRPDAKIPALNYILTSLCWRNCYSHQNPGLLSSLLLDGFPNLRIYTPPDVNSLLASASLSLSSYNRVNIIVASKTPIPSTFSYKEALRRARRGISRNSLPNENDTDIDIVLAVIGDSLTQNADDAIQHVRRTHPHIKIRSVVVSELTILGAQKNYPHALSDQEFARYFTKDKKVVFAFTGFPYTLKALLFDRPFPSRFIIQGYADTGGITKTGEVMRFCGLDKESLAHTIIAESQSRPVNC